MAWLSQNWFWVLIGVVFIGMHLFGHGGHGGHPRGKTAESDDPHKAFEKDGNTSQSENHQHKGGRSC